MKIAKRIVSLIMVAVLCTMVTFAHPFNDISGHWAEPSIAVAFDRGTVAGDPDGRFRPDDTVSRAEFVKMLVCELCNGLGVEIPDDYGKTSDHWAAKYTEYAADAICTPLTEAETIDGVIPGRIRDGEFDLPISRWEMAYMVGSAMLNVFEAVGEGDYADRESVDNELPKEVSAAISSCMYLGLITGDENGRFLPFNNGTRAEAVAIIERVDGIVTQVVSYIEEQNKIMEAQKKALEESNITYTKIPTGHPIVTIVMSDNSRIKIELYPEYAPQTVANFVELVKSGFYDGLTFHRIVDGFMAQGGDPDGTGMGGSEHTIKGEFAANGFTQNTLSHTRGVISMARSTLFDSASSQFFICYDDASFLDGQYAAFGKVVEGMDTLDKFLQVERTANSMGELATPVEPIVMKKVTVK